jgi:integrase/recombinase XerD
MTIDRRKYLSEKQIKQLCDYWRKQVGKPPPSKNGRKLKRWLKGKANALRAWMLIDLAVHTGLRASELCSVHLEDINFDEGWIVVHRKKKKKDGELDVIPLPWRLAKHIQEYCAAFKITKGQLLLSARGPYKPQGLAVLWKAALKKAKVRHVRLHGARHSLAVQMQRKYKNLRMVQKQLGHRNINTTASIYADVPFEDQQKAANELWE